MGVGMMSSFPGRASALADARCPLTRAEKSSSMNCPSVSGGLSPIRGHGGALARYARQNTLLEGRPQHRQAAEFGNVESGFSRMNGVPFRHGHASQAPIVGSSE